MRTVTKTIITTVLLTTVLAMASNVEARLKYYRYNDNIPMVEMSLNMMVAMGVLEPIPGRLVQDGNPYNRMVNTRYGPYSRSGYAYPERAYRYSSYGYNDYLDGPIDPYDSYYGGYNDRYYGSRYGYSPDYPRYRTWGNTWGSPWEYQSGYPWNSYYDGGTWGNPWNSYGGGPWGNQWNSPWGNTLGSPWEYQSGYPWNSYWDGGTWGNPWNSYGGGPWGNQGYSPWGNTLGSPWEYQSYNPWNSYRGGGAWGNQGYSPWGNTWGSPWGSAWSNPWMNPWSTSQLGYPGTWPYTQGYSTLPLSPDETLGEDWSKNNAYKFDDSSRLDRNKESYKDKNSYKAEKTSWSAYPSRKIYKRSGYRNSNNRTYRKLNGLWIGDNGAMLGIRGNRFLWYDDNNQYTTGQLARSPTMMKARIEGSATAVRYHYRLHGNELVIISRDGMMHTFNRMPLEELPAVSARPRATYSVYRPESAYANVSYSNFGSGLKANNSSLYSRNNSARVGQGTDMNGPAHSLSPREYDSYERSSARSPNLPYASHRSTDNSPSVSRPADSGSDFHMTEAFINNVGPEHHQHQPQITPLESSDASTPATPMYKHVQPAAGRPEPENGTDSAALPAEDIRVESNTWTNYAGLDMNDPNTYLYSYLRDNDNKRRSSSSSTEPDNSEGSASSTVAKESDRSNIWKPNDTFPDHRGYTANSQSNHATQNTGWVQSEMTADSGMKRFAWPDGGRPWE